MYSAQSAGEIRYSFRMDVDRAVKRMISSTATLHSALEFGCNYPGGSDESTPTPKRAKKKPRTDGNTKSVESDHITPKWIERKAVNKEDKINPNGNALGVESKSMDAAGAA